MDFVLCTDFDRTLTSADTIHCIVNSAIHSSKRCESEQLQIKQDWTELSHAYEQKLQALFQAKFQNVEDFLIQFGKEDLNSINDVISRKILYGIDWNTQLSWMSKCIGSFLYVDYFPMFQLAASVHIITSNWSGEAIMKAIEYSYQQHQQTFPNDVEVHGNQLKLDPNAITTGEIELTMQSPFDKSNVVKQLRQEYGTKKVILFVGDSVNDLDALLQADVGVIFGQNSLLNQCIAKFKIQVKPMDPHHKILIGKQILYRIHSWTELYTMLTRGSLG